MTLTRLATSASSRSATSTSGAQLLSDLAAERTVIGQCLRSEDAFEHAFSRLEEAAFCNEGYRDIWRTMTRLWNEEAHVSPATVSFHLGHDLDWLDRAPQVPWTAFQMATETVLGLWRRNRLAFLGAELQHRALDIGEDEGGLLLDIAERLERPELSIETTTQSLSLPEFMAQNVSYDWLVPGLIERGDRILVTGAEGGGKSMLLRQWALTMALGLDPVNLSNLEAPLRVLYVDCENSVAQTQRVLGKMLTRAGYPAPATLFLEIRPQGLDLLSAADQRWLTSKISAVTPDLVIGGPLYKLFVAGPEDESSARHVAAYFDRLRRRFGVALMLEAHSPHGFAGDRAGLRPFGSSLWMRWPEFGFGLASKSKKDASKVEVVHWRGMRDAQRHFPPGMEWSPTSFPWRCTF